jgi:hypothetical protein
MTRLAKFSIEPSQVKMTNPQIGMSKRRKLTEQEVNLALEQARQIGELIETI